MKNLIAAIAIIITVSIAGACTKGSNSPTNFYNMTATIDGTHSFVADGPSKAYITGSTSGGAEYTDLYGKADDGKVIKLTLITTPGTPLPRGASIPVNTGQVRAYYYPNGFTADFVLGVTGSVILTTIFPSYEGSFNFTCSDSTHITNGKFSIKAP